MRTITTMVLRRAPHVRRRAHDTPAVPPASEHTTYAQRLARLRIEVLDAFERSRSQIEGQLADLIDNYQARLLQTGEHARLGAIAGQSLHLIEQAKPGTVRRGAKGLAHLERLVNDLVDAALVHSD